MYKQIEKKENESRAIATSVTQKKSNVKQDFEFVDNRSEAIAQLKLQRIDSFYRGGNPIQMMTNTKGCTCPFCTGVTSANTTGQSIPAQLTCNEGHKNHKKGPCPNSAQGKVANSNKNHNPNAGVSGGDGSAKANAGRDAYAMANKDGKKTRKELNREYKESQKKGGQ